jgi:hypothetical protein
VEESKSQSLSLRNDQCAHSSQCVAESVASRATRTTSLSDLHSDFRRGCSPVRSLLSSDPLFERNMSVRVGFVRSSSHWLSLGIASNEYNVDDSRCLWSVVQLDHHADLLGSKRKYYLGFISGSPRVHRKGGSQDRLEGRVRRLEHLQGCFNGFACDCLRNLPTAWD